MYWICFGDSAKGLLACARSGMEEAVEYDHILLLGDDLSVGELSDLRSAEKRAFGVCPWKDDPEFSDAVDDCFRRYFEEALPLFDQVDKAVLWYGDNPAEQCGMLRAAHDLYARGVPFSLVHVDCLKGDELPPPRPPHCADGPAAVGIITSNDWVNRVLAHTPQFLIRYIHYWSRQRRYQRRRAVLVAYRGVGELEPETARIFYGRRRRVPDCEAKRLYSRWEQLVRENAPLRVLGDGKPVSAPVDFYDEAILTNTPEEETGAALVIGRVLGEFPVGDGFLFERIRALAAAERLEIVKNGGNYRETTVRRGPCRN